MSNLDLLHAHLSGVTTPDDTDALDAALANDPALARELAEAARVEAQLTAHFAPNRLALSLVAELQCRARTSPAVGSTAKGGRCFQPVLAPPVTNAQARRGQAGSTDLPFWPAPAGVNGGKRLVAASADARRSRPRIRDAAAVLLALGLVAATISWLTRQPDASSADSQGAPVTGSKPRSPGAQANGFPKPPSFAQQDESPELRALRRRLEAYYLTDLGLDQSVPLSQALERLLSRARELNHLRQPVIDALALAPAEARSPTKVPEPVVRLPRNNLNLMDALQLVAAQAQSEIRLTPPGIISLRPLPKLASSKLVTRTLRVRPDFLPAQPDAATSGESQRIQAYENAYTLQLQLQTREGVSDYKSQLESIKNKGGAELIAAAAYLGIEDPKTVAIHSAYLADQTNLKRMEKIGAGPNHPDVVAVKAAIETAKLRLEEGAARLRRMIETKLHTASSFQASMERITQETGQQERLQSILEAERVRLASAPADVDARPVLENLGLSFPEKTSAIFNPSDGSVTVTHTEAALRQLEASLAVDARVGTPMISASMKMFEFAGGHELENRLMDSARFQSWLKEQNALPGVSILSTPQVMTRSGQDASIQNSLDREVPGRTEPDWQGMRIDLHPTLEGEVVRLTGSAEVRRSRDSGSGQPLGDPGAADTELVSTAVDLQAIIPLGQTALFSLSENADGPHLVGAITIDLVVQETVEKGK